MLRLVWIRKGTKQTFGPRWIIRDLRRANGNARGENIAVIILIQRSAIDGIANTRENSLSMRVKNARKYFEANGKRKARLIHLRPRILSRAFQWSSSFKYHF
jgi:hypothetical protein